MDRPRSRRWRPCSVRKISFRKPGSCGRAVLNVELASWMIGCATLAPGEIGEIVHRSPHLMLGYFHDDERTKAAFEGGWFIPAISPPLMTTATSSWSIARRT